MKRKKLIDILDKKYDILWDMKNDNDKEKYIIAGGMAILEQIFKELEK